MVDPDPDPQDCNIVFSFSLLRVAGCSRLGAEGFSCSLDVLYGGLRISKLQAVHGSLPIDDNPANSNNSVQRKLAKKKRK
jgi:hypothetical protein